MSLIIHELTDGIKFLFNSGHNYPKPKEVDEDRERKLINTLAKCFRCNGTGWILSGSEIGENIASSYGSWGSIHRSPYITCPLCKGTGHIENGNHANE